MRLKKGFTLVELIAVIVILALLLVLLIPNITNISKNSKESLRESKIRTIVTASEEYGNDDINTYSGCVYGVSGEVLKEDCTITVNRLVRMGYIEGEDDDDNIINPVTNEAFEGDILLCYNPAEVNVYGYYVDDGDYACKEIVTDTANTLNLSSINGVGYVGGKTVEINLIPNGSFTGFACDVDDVDDVDSQYASCTINSRRKLIITPTGNKNIVINDEYVEVPVTVTGYYNDKYGEASEMHKVYTLKLYPTSMEIEEDDDVCMPSGTTNNLLMLGKNMGRITVTSNNSRILEGTSKDNYLYISAGNTTGEATLTIKESNGNNSTTLSKNVYKLNVGTIPESMTLLSVVEVPITYGGTGDVTITSDNPSVAQFSLDGEEFSDSLVLTGEEDKFYFTVIDAGIGTVIVQGATCGKVEQSFSSTNLTLSEHETYVYVGGHSTTIDIESEVVQTYSCVSEDPEAAQCELHGASVEIKPGTKASDEVKLHIRGALGGYDVVKVQVLKTSIELINSSGEDVDTVCISTDSDENSTDVIARGTNMGKTTIYNIEDWYLAEATILNDRLTLTKRELGENDAHDQYKAGYNTGITEIDVRESNGNAMDSFDYHVYSMSLSSTSGTIKIDDSIEFTVNYSATGDISVSSSNGRVAKAEVVEVTNNESDTGPNINVVNTAKIKVTGVGSGTAVISVRGADCGVKTYTMVVEGRNLSVILAPGTYTSSLEKTSLSCRTEGTSKSCEVEFPEIYTTDEFEVVGYSKTKDDTSYEYQPGDKLELTKETTGATYYGNSRDVTSPVCSIPSFAGEIVVGEIAYMTLTCIDTGSGISGNGILSVDDFFSSDETIGNVVEVGSPVSITNGYSYKVGIRGDAVGMFNIALRSNSIADKFGNGNAQIGLNNLLSSEAAYVSAWFIGKEVETDVLAVLYENSEYKGEGETGYSLVMYGQNDMRDYITEEYNYYPGWYDYRTEITDVIIEEGITNVGSGILYNASNLENVTIPSTATYIGARAFTYNNISSIEIPDSVTTIEDYAFYGNPITSLNLSSNLVGIGESAFYNHQIESLSIPSSLEVIGGYAFATESDKTALSSLSFDLGSSLATIGEAAFLYHALTSLTIPASVQTIGASAFAQANTQEASTLRNLEFESDSSLTTIGDDAFFCARLESILLPDSVESIGARSFGTLREGVTTFHIGPNVNSLGTEFAYGKELKEFTVDENNEHFTALDGVLYTSNMETLVKCPDDYYKENEMLDVPSSVTTLQSGAFNGWLDYGEGITGFTLNLPSGITNMNIDENFIFFTIGAINISENDEFVSVDGVLFNKDETIIYRLPPAYDSDSYTIPDSVTVVADYFSYGNSRIQTLTVPESVTEIGYRAFMSDSQYGFGTIDLNSGAELSFDETSLAAMTYDENGDITNQTKTINVKYEDLKTKIETAYEGVPYTLVVNVVS